MTKSCLIITALSIFLAKSSFCGEGRFLAELSQYTPGGNHSPLEITTGATAGIRFNATSPFISVKLICPSYNNSLGSLTVTLYRWQGSVEHSRQSGKLASNRFVNFRDNEKLALEFNPLPPGTYYAELSDPEEKVGVWKSNSAPNPQTASFFRGKPIDGTLELAIVLTNAKEPPAPSAGCGASGNLAAEPAGIAGEGTDRQGGRDFRRHRQKRLADRKIGRRTVRLGTRTVLRQGYDRPRLCH